MRSLYKNDGDIEGLFIAKDSDIKTAIGKRVHLGEVLCKHSDVWFDLKESHLEVVSVDHNFLNEIEYEFQSTNLCGYNPLNYLRD